MTRAMTPLEAAALRCFAPLPLAERLHVRARLASAPLTAMVERTPAGRVADVGCGHGLLTALLAVQGPARTVVGIDPDARKIAAARAGPGRLPNVHFDHARIEELATAQPGTFDAVVVADVLYLLTADAARTFLTSARTLLRPGGILVLKEAEDDGGWRTRKALWQERVMVQLLRRTHGSGGLGFVPRPELVRRIGDAGFVLDEVVGLAKGYATPHVLFRAHRGD